MVSLVSLNTALMSGLIGYTTPNHSFALIERMVAREIAVGTDISILRIPRVEVSSSGHFSAREGSGLVLNIQLLEKPSPMRQYITFPRSFL